MPKEITHWLIALSAAGQLQGTSFGRAAADCLNCLKLGAVFPDALFYNRNGADTKRFRSLADELHGARGEDTYRIVREVFNSAADEKKKEPLAAFLLGIISHIQADSSFHPLVYYLSGDYDHPDPCIKTLAVGSHRRFECLMDLYFCGGFQTLKSYSLKNFLRKAELPPTILLEKTLARISREKDWPDLIEATVRAFDFFSFMQRLSHNRALSRLLHDLSGWLPDAWKEVTSLFYAPQLLRKMPLMSELFAYRNPVTGQGATERLETLFQSAVDKTVSVCRVIEPALINHEPFPITSPGPSLAFGLEGACRTQARYFLDTPFI